jgi:ABC-type multidrug transport system fused ATPase/permease subunit
MKPAKSWPLRGQIIMRNVTLHYEADAPPVLRDVTCTINAREKIGIVGRTGAGKSSLISALFRITELTSGAIEIDGVNVLRIGLHDLRSKISIIPQDPVLFIGTLRRNLDPFNDFDDDLLWGVLQDVHLTRAVAEMGNNGYGTDHGLDTQVSTKTHFPHSHGNHGKLISWRQ